MENHNIEEATEMNQESRWTKPTVWLCSLHIFTLCTLAFAKPIYDITSRDAAFYVVRGSHAVDIVSLILILSVAIPLALSALEAISRLCGQHFQYMIHLVLVGALFSVYASPLVKHLKVDGVVAILVVLGVGVCATFLYSRTQSFRRLLSLASPFILLIPAFFMFGTDVRQLMLPDASRDTDTVRLTFKNKPPIVFIQLDELPVVTLLDPDGNIDSKRFPNLAAFAKTAYWFPFTTTVSSETTTAIPAILTGVTPSEKSLPTLADHPNSLFTLLANSYKFNVHETATYLCPSELSNRRTAPAFNRRMAALSSDLCVVFLHATLPDVYTRKLPPITNQWGDFKGYVRKPESQKPPTEKEIVGKIYTHLEDDRAALFDKFIQSVTRDKETLHFIHIMLPHNPMEYLPSGKRHSVSTEVEGIVRSNDKFIGPQGLVDQYRYRHVLQMSYVDSKIGKLIQKLKELHVFDDALIVIMSDHGASFTSNVYNRRLSDRNVGDLAFVPLLIKTPGQHEGVTADFEATTVDVLPTIADVLGAKLPWQVSGQSLLNKQRPAKPTRGFLGDDGKIHVYEYKKLLQMREHTLARNSALFSLTDPRSTLFRFGKHLDLMGRSVQDFKIRPSKFQIQIDQDKLIDHIDLRSNFIPAKISGRVIDSPLNPVPAIAISVNDVIQAVPDVYKVNDSLIFSTVIPESAYKPGKNDMRCYLVATGQGGDKVLIEPHDGSSSEDYRLTPNALITSEKSFPIKNGALQGYVDVLKTMPKNGSNIMLAGWAANLKKSKHAEKVVIFINGTYFGSSRTDAARPDVAVALKKKNLKHTGFQNIIPARFAPHLRTLRTFAISDGIACELTYNPDLKLGQVEEKGPPKAKGEAKAKGTSTR